MQQYQKELDDDVDPHRLYDALMMRDDDIDAAMLEFEALRAQGSSLATAVLGNTYLYGTDGIPVDEEKGEALVSEACKMGSIEAAFRLACYFDFKSRHEEAFELYKDLGERGFSPALYRLGWAYETGRGVEEDQQKALECFENAYKQGHLVAQQKLSFDLRQSSKLSERLYGIYLLATLIIPRRWEYSRHPNSDRIRVI